MSVEEYCLESKYLPRHCEKDVVRKQSTFYDAKDYYLVIMMTDKVCQWIAALIAFARNDDRAERMS